MPPDPSADQARAAIQAELGQIGFCLPGSITIRHARCGKPRCACAAGTRRLRELAADLEALSLAEMARAEGWAKITPGTPAPPRTRPVRGPNPNYPKPPKMPGDKPA